MNNTSANVRRMIRNAENLQSIVRTMKTLAASSIGQYEGSARALADYYRTIELGLGASLRAGWPASQAKRREQINMVAASAVVFGSDQGLVGEFNDMVVDYAIKTLRAISENPRVWAVGERVCTRLTGAGLSPESLFDVPNSVKAIASLVGQIQIASETRQTESGQAYFYIFYNRPRPGGLYKPFGRRLLPLDSQWQQALMDIHWPTMTVPEIIPSDAAALGPLIREYLFISLFRACAESLVSENSSRLAAMQRADRNIEELLENLHDTFNGLRQSSIDEDLFDVISGYELLMKESRDVGHGYPIRRELFSAEGRE